MSDGNIENTLEALTEARGVRGVFAVSLDGFLIQSVNLPSADPDGVAALSAVALGTATRIAENVDMGGLRWMLLEFKRGRILIAWQSDCVWAVLADKTVVVGALLQHLRRRAERVDSE